MDAAEFLGLQTGGGPGRWRLPVVPGISTGGGFLFGGCALGAAIAALEGTTGRPVVWATAQYLSFARPPSIVDIEVTEVVRGHAVSQARAAGRADGQEIFTVNAALGARPSEAAGSWAVRPDVPAPDDCPPRPLTDHHRNTISERLDVRIAQGREPELLDGVPGDGRSSMWIRLPGTLDVSGASLGILGDWVPFGIGQSLGVRAGGTSLDNTIRVMRLVPTDWVLLDIRIHAVAHGFGHGLVHLWAEDGTLLGTASQTARVRYWDTRRRGDG